MKCEVWGMQNATMKYALCTMHYGSTTCVWHSDISLRILIGVLISTNGKTRLAHHLCQWQIDCNSLTSIMNKIKSEIPAWVYPPIFQALVVGFLGSWRNAWQTSTESANESHSHGLRMTCPWQQSVSIFVWPLFAHVPVTDYLCGMTQWNLHPWYFDSWTWRCSLPLN